MIIRKCRCISAYQDAHYGVGNRVHTIGVVKGKPNGIETCSVCGRGQRHVASRCGASSRDLTAIARKMGVAGGV